MQSYNFQLELEAKTATEKKYSNYLWTIEMRKAITLMLDNDLYNDAIAAITKLNESKQTYCMR